jgi:hypothetical protein
MSDTPPNPVPEPTPAAAAAPAVLPAENLMKGTLLALLIIPAGVIAWGFVAALGYI